VGASIPNPRLCEVLLDPITERRVHPRDWRRIEPLSEKLGGAAEKESIVAAASIEPGSGRSSKAVPSVAPRSWLEAPRPVILINTINAVGPNMAINMNAGPNLVVKGAKLLRMRLGTVQPLIRRIQVSFRQIENATNQMRFAFTLGRRSQVGQTGKGTVQTFAPREKKVVSTCISLDPH
jgi:hypothetical protein